MQEKLFFDDENDALVTAILSAGGWKHVATKLWPHRKPDAAYSRLKACLDPEKYEKLEFREMLAIARMAREKQCHAFMQYLGAELAYQCAPLDPKDEQADLYRKFIRCKEDLSEIADRIERNNRVLGVAR